VPNPNACAGQGFNCVFVHGINTPAQLQLSSQANTGLKIPPGQILGGPITVASGSDVDLNIDFNACASIIQQGNGQFRLKPVLTAGQVGTNATGISGQVIDAATQVPIVLGANGTVLVAVELQDSTGVDRIFAQENTDSSGNFNFCPLPTGATFDVVAVAINGAGVAYNATVAVNVPGGTNLGKIPLTPETGSTGPTTLQGFVTAKSGSSAATIDAAVSALQTVSLGNNLSRDVTIPAEQISTSITSTANLSVSSTATCPGGAPPNSNCAQYSLIEPASNPRVGIVSAGIVASYALPPSGDVLFKVRSAATVPFSGGTADCTSPSITTSQDTSSNPLKAIAGTTVQAKEIDFSGCS
jgi:hypothetical protein